MTTILTKFQLKPVTTVGFVADQGGRGFHLPTDFAIRSDGRVFVASRSNTTALDIVGIQMATVEHEFFGQLGGYGRAPGQMIWPSALALDSQENLYLADDFLQRITVYDRDGNVQTTWGEQGDGDGQFNLPWGITQAPDGHLYVADWRNDRIQKFTADGEFVAKFGTSGNGEGEFARPSGLAVDSDGNMYVADWMNQRVQVLDADGGFIQQLRGDGILGPWATEYLNANAAELEARSKFVPVVAVDTDDPNETSARIEPYFWDPVRVALDAEERVYVLETSRHRFQVYEKA